MLTILERNYISFLCFFCFLVNEIQMIKPETRAPLIKFFQLLAAHHPSKKYPFPSFLFILICNNHIFSVDIYVCYSIVCAAVKRRFCLVYICIEFSFWLKHHIQWRE